MKFMSFQENDAITKWREIAGDDTSLTEQSKDQEEQMKEFWIILTRSESRKEKLTWTLFQDHCKVLDRPSHMNPQVGHIGWYTHPFVRQTMASFLCLTALDPGPDQ